jgi:uncharacterized protein with NRDE domain
MCLAVFAWNIHSQYKLILAANRDEFYARPTKAIEEWEDQPGIIAGRDLKAGGTWLGVNKSGKLSLLTNYRDLRLLKENAPSRGKLVTDFLIGTQDPLDYLSKLHQPELYNGFNLIVSDFKVLAWYSNIQKEVLELEPGVYGISNHLLDSPWPKVLNTKRAFQAVLIDKFEHQDLLEILKDSTEALSDKLPDTGLDIYREKKLSAGFIRTPDYGTVSSSVITIDYSGYLSFTERTFDPYSNNFKDQNFNFKLY